MHEPYEEGRSRKMSCINQWTEKLNSPEAADHLTMLYGPGTDVLARQRERYLALIRKHEETFGEGNQVSVFSAPGRTEIGGNHTDHNRGRVLAASVNLDILCAASPREDGIVHFNSEGFQPLTLDLSNTERRQEEEGSTLALIRGVFLFLNFF